MNVRDFIRSLDDEFSVTVIDPSEEVSEDWLTMKNSV
jgi:hypothetical protein